MVSPSAELRNEALEHSVWFAIAHDTDIQTDADNFRQHAPHGAVDPLWLVAKGSAAKVCLRRERRDRRGSGLGRQSFFSTQRVTVPHCPQIIGVVAQGRASWQAS